MARIKPYFYEIVLILLSSFPALEPLFRKGIFTAHDIEANIGRFAAFFMSVSEGHILPGWAGYVANGYGSPILLFTYLLPYYLQLPIKMFGFSLTDTVKIYILLTYILSALFMYLFLKRHVSKPAAFIGALFYSYAPYRINDIYARGSISEQTAFMLIPLVGLAIYGLYSRGKWVNVILLALAITGLLMSHPFILLISGFFYGFYILYLNLQKRWHIDWKFLLYLTGGGLIALGLCAFFLLPLALENKYLHYNINPLNLSWSNQAVPFIKLLRPEWTFVDITGKVEYQTWQIGLLHIFTLVSGLVLFLRNKFRNKFLALGIITGLTGIFFQLPIAYPVYAKVGLLQHIQFPWRFMSLTVLGISLIAAGLVNELRFPKKTSQLWIFSVVMIGALLALNLPYAKGHGYREIPDHYYKYELKDNTEGISTTPIWADAPEKYARASFLPQTVLPADLSYIYRSSEKHIYKIGSENQNMVIDNTFYFPNWHVLIDKQPVNIEFQNPDYRGLITFQTPPGEHLVEVIFSDTKLRRLAKIITAVSWAAVVIYLFKLLKLRFKKV